MLLPRALLVPHLSTLALDEHRRHRTPMLEALHREGERLRAERPDIMVVASAHAGPRGPFEVGVARAHRSLTEDPAFGVEVRYDCPGHPRLARALVEAGTRAGVRVGPSQRGLDSGVYLPLHFLLPARGVPVVPLALSDRPESECRAWGAIVRRVLAGHAGRIGFVVGGMLSHATHAWHFRREVPEATILDQHVLAALAEGRWDDVAKCTPRVLERAAPEAGLRHLALLRGFLDSEVQGELLCYEAGPGMGSALVAFEVPGGVSVASAVAPPTTEIVPITVRPTPPVRPRPRPASPRRPARPPAASGPQRSGRGRPAKSRPAGQTRDVSAGSRTPRPRGRARASRPGPKRRG